MEVRRTRKSNIGLETHFPNGEKAQPHLPVAIQTSLPKGSPGWEKKKSLPLPVDHQLYFLFEI